MEPNVRKARTCITPPMLAILQRSFDVHAGHPPPTERGRLAKQLEMTPKSVQVWFQNRRQKFRAQRTSLKPGEQSPIPDAALHGGPDSVDKLSPTDLAAGAGATPNDSYSTVSFQPLAPPRPASAPSGAMAAAPQAGGAQDGQQGNSLEAIHEIHALQKQVATRTADSGVLGSSHLSNQGWGLLQGGGLLVVGGGLTPSGGGLTPPGGVNMSLLIRELINELASVASAEQELVVLAQHLSQRKVVLLQQIAFHERQMGNSQPPLDSRSSSQTSLDQMASDDADLQLKLPSDSPLSRSPSRQEGGVFPYGGGAIHSAAPPPRAANAAQRNFDLNAAPVYLHPGGTHPPDALSARSSPYELADAHGEANVGGQTKFVKDENYLEVGDCGREPPHKHRQADYSSYGTDGIWNGNTQNEANNPYKVVGGSNPYDVVGSHPYEVVGSNGWHAMKHQLPLSEQNGVGARRHLAAAANTPPHIKGARQAPIHHAGLCGLELLSATASHF